MATEEAIRAGKRPRRVGHKGAAHLAQGNTRESFDAALAHGMDMIEFDVLSERPDGSGDLFVAHDYEDMRSRTPLTLQQALEHLAGDSFAGLDFDVDVKLPGYELRVVDALREATLTGRALISGMYPSSLARVRAAEPALRLGWSVPRVRRDYTSDMLTAIPALAMLTGYRALLPRRAREALQAVAAEIPLPKERVSCTVASGGVYHELLREAQEWRADLIVIGSHRPVMSDYLLGSNAKTIVRHAQCSVLVVRT